MLVWETMKVNEFLLLTLRYQAIKSTQEDKKHTREDRLQFIMNVITTQMF